MYPRKLDHIIYVRESTDMVWTKYLQNFEMIISANEIVKTYSAEARSI